PPGRPSGHGGTVGRLPPGPGRSVRRGLRAGAELLADGLGGGESDRRGEVPALDLTEDDIGQRQVDRRAIEVDHGAPFGLARLGNDSQGAGDVLIPRGAAPRAPAGGVESTDMDTMDTMGVTHDRPPFSSRRQGPQSDRGAEPSDWGSKG